MTPGQRISIPQGFESLVQAQLNTVENVLAVLEVDLDEQLFFSKGLLLATDQRLLSWERSSLPSPTQVQ